MSSPAAGLAIPVRSRPPGRASHRPLPQDSLEKHKATIRRLYLDDGLPLRDVMGVMEKQHGVTASSKVYKSRFKTWGWRKNLRIEDEVLPEVIRGRSQAPTREFQLANGQVFDGERLDRYLRRRKSRVALVRQYLGQQGVQSARLSPEPRSITPPDKFHVIEAVFYQILFRVPTYIHTRWGDAFQKTDVIGALRLTQPSASTDRWSIFVYGLKCMLQSWKYEEALMLLHQAPQEVGTFVRAQPTELMSGLFMLLAQSTRYCHPDKSPAERQFLRVVKSLTRYAASILFEVAQTNRSTWVHLVAVLIEAFSRIEDRDLTETIFRAWEVHSQTWDRQMPATVSSELTIGKCDNLAVSKYRVLPVLTPGCADALEEVVEKTDAQYGPQQKEAMQALWTFAQYSETDDDSKGLVGGYSARTRRLFEELRRREPQGHIKTAMWRFFADDHRLRGEHEEAEQSMRNAIEAVGDMWSPQHPLVLGYVSTLKDWLVEWYGEDSARALELARWDAELKSAAMASRGVPSPTSTGTPASSV